MTISPAKEEEEDGVESIDSAGQLHPKTPKTKPIPSGVGEVGTGEISPLSDPQTSPNSEESKPSEGSFSSVASVLGDSDSVSRYLSKVTLSVVNALDCRSLGIADIEGEVQAAKEIEGEVEEAKEEATRVVEEAEEEDESNDFEEVAEEEAWEPLGMCHGDVSVCVRENYMGVLVGMRTRVAGWQGILVSHSATLHWYQENNKKYKKNLRVVLFHLSEKKSVKKSFDYGSLEVQAKDRPRLHGFS